LALWQLCTIWHVLCTFDVAFKPSALNLEAQPVNKTKAKFTFALATAFAALVALACAGASASARTLAEIKASGELRIGDEVSYVPFAFRKDGVAVGYDIDVADGFCKALEVKCVVVDTVWAGIIPALLADKFDVIMGQMDYSPERMTKVGFSIPYTEASQAMLVRATDKDTIKSLDDLSGKIMAVKLGSPGAQMKDKIAAKIKADRGEAPSDIKTFDDHPAAYLALADGRVDGVLNSFTTLAVLCKDQPGKFAIVPQVGSDNWAGLATLPANTELIAFLDKTLLAMKADGALAELQKKWFGLTMNLPDTIPTPK
jgi:polar amino acid transport system substrate-binding protein